MQLTEAEIRGLCLKSREIFLSQPILLELEAPLKICGELTTGVAKLFRGFHTIYLASYLLQVTSMGSTMTFCVCLNTGLST